MTGDSQVMDMVCEAGKETEWRDTVWKPLQLRAARLITHDRSLQLDMFDDRTDGPHLDFPKLKQEQFDKFLLFTLVQYQNIKLRLPPKHVKTLRRTGLSCRKNALRSSSGKPCGPPISAALEISVLILIVSRKIPLPLSWSVACRRSITFIAWSHARLKYPRNGNQRTRLAGRSMITNKPRTISWMFWVTCSRKRTSDITRDNSISLRALGYGVLVLM